ncbi:helix-turn-helix transcriptional regulator [Segetibacter aerophilus]|nr:LuxR C-terminal-related transcriptional regulator [Segetibacter aerophilus]
MFLKFIQRYRHALLYGFSMAAVLVLLQVVEYRFLLLRNSFEIYIATIAILFTLLGIWLASRLMRPKVKTQIETIVVEKEVHVVATPSAEVNEAERAKLGLSTRELEVLVLMADGLSNQEIAERLFVSLNTVKTHTSKLFEKLDVKRRTQAVGKAKQLNIIN